MKIEDSFSIVFLSVIARGTSEVTQTIQFILNGLTQYARGLLCIAFALL